MLTSMTNQQLKTIPLKETTVIGIFDRGQGKIIDNKHYDKGQDNEKRPRIETRGSIINKTGKKIIFPQGLHQIYCSDFLDAGEACRHWDKCRFVHAVYRGGFIEKDKSIVDDFIKNEPGLSFNPNCKVANKNVSTKGSGQ